MTTSAGRGTAAPSVFGTRRSSRPRCCRTTTSTPTWRASCGSSTCTASTRWSRSTRETWRWDQCLSGFTQAHIFSIFKIFLKNFTNVFLKSCRHERMKAKNSNKVSQIMFCFLQRRVMALWKSKSGRYVHLASLPQRDITTRCNLARDCLNWDVLCVTVCGPLPV